MLARVRQVLIEGQPFVSEDLTNTLSGLGPPAHYLDFEYFQPPVPIYSETRPYQRVAFQFSIQTQIDDDQLQETGFLAEGRDDPRPELARRLVEALSDDDWPIMVYSVGAERSVLNDLRQVCSELEGSLAAIDQRLIDLLPVVRNHYYHQALRGSFSIKAVAPVLTPEVSYDGLDLIAGGIQAAAAFDRLVRNDLMPDENADRLRSALIAYCAQDTLALVRLHKHLSQLGRDGGTT